MRFYQPAICSTQKEKEKKIETSNLLGPDVVFALQDPSNLLWFIIGNLEFLISVAPEVSGAPGQWVIHKLR